MRRSSCSRLELTDGETARPAWRAVHDAVRANRVGELSAPADKWSDLDDTSSGPAGPRRYLIHRDPGGSVDGVANYRTEPEPFNTFVF